MTITRRLPALACAAAIVAAACGPPPPPDPILDPTVGGVNHDEFVLVNYVDDIVNGVYYGRCEAELHVQIVLDRDYAANIYSYVNVHPVGDVPGCWYTQWGGLMAWANCGSFGQPFCGTSNVGVEDNVTQLQTLVFKPPGPDKTFLRIEFQGTWMGAGVPAPVAGHTDTVQIRCKPGLCVFIPLHPN